MPVGPPLAIVHSPLARAAETAAAIARARDEDAYVREVVDEHTGAIAAELGTLHVNLTAHPACTDPTLYSSDGRHGNSRSDAIALAEVVRLLGAHLATNSHVTRP